MIEIKYDCPENLDAMPKQGCGVYCDACQKNVYDFRGKSLDQINQIKLKDRSISCGIFDSEVAFVDNRKSVSQIFRIAFAAIFVMGFNATILFGADPHKVENNSNIQLRTEVVSGKVYVSGKVVNKRGKGLLATINYSIGEESFQVLTQEDGQFKFELENRYLGMELNMNIQADGMISQYIHAENLVAKCYEYEITMVKYKRPRRHRRIKYAGKF